MDGVMILLALTNSSSTSPPAFVDFFDFGGVDLTSSDCCCCWGNMAIVFIADFRGWVVCVVSGAEGSRLKVFWLRLGLES